MALFIYSFTKLMNIITKLKIYGLMKEMTSVIGF